MNWLFPLLLCAWGVAAEVLDGDKPDDLLDVDRTALRLHLAGGWPAEWTALRFPTNDVARRQMEYWRAAVEYQEGQERLRPWSTDVAARLDRARWAFRVWDTLDNAQRFGGVFWKREQLDALRRMIGPEAFARGEMPLP